LHSTVGSSDTYTVDNATYGKGIKGELGVDYFIVSRAEEVLYECANLPENIQKAFTNKIITDNAIKLDSSNIALLQSATDGYYILTEDIYMKTVDLNGEEDGIGLWDATTHFTGVVNGQGHTIYDLCGDGLFQTLGAARISNLLLKDAYFENSNGYLATTTKDSVVIENVAITVQNASVSNGFNSLLGYQTGGTAKITNVYIQVPEKGNFLNDAHGFISCHAFTGYELENVYMVGGHGTVHSIGHSGNAAGYPYDESKVIGVEGTDYHFLTSETVASAIETAPQFIKDAYAKLYPAQ
jgi:hypothetical protein